MERILSEFDDSAYWGVVVSFVSRRAPAIEARAVTVPRSLERAGLLCVQDLEIGLRALSKLAGKVAGYEDEFSTQSAIKESEAGKEVKNTLVLLVSILEAAENTHPFVCSACANLAAGSLASAASR